MIERAVVDCDDDDMGWSPEATVHRRMSWQLRFAPRSQPTRKPEASPVIFSRQTYNPPISSAMRAILNVLAVLCLFVGSIWILQGINILPGSFMTGQSKWAIYGGVLA